MRPSLGLGYFNLIVLGLLYLVCSQAIGADEVVISDDGRQIQLNGDGTWVQLSKDRFAVNAAGQRVRLKPNGTWTLAGAVAGARSASQALTPVTAAQESTLFLPKVEILKRRIKRAKSVHAETRSIFYLQVVNESDQSLQVSRALMQQLEARSSNGKRYPIVEIEPATLVIDPGQRGTIRVVAEGSPQWFGVKRMVLEVAAGALGNSQTRVLSKLMADVEKRDVESLE